MKDNQPGIRIFKTCRNLVRTLGMLPTDDKNPEDVDTHAEDHAYDALRYGCMSRPTHPNMHNDLDFQQFKIHIIWQIINLDINVVKKKNTRNK